MLHCILDDLQHDPLLNEGISVMRATGEFLQWILHKNRSIESFDVCIVSANVYV